MKVQTFFALVRAVILIVVGCVVICSNGLESDHFDLIGGGASFQHGVKLFEKEQFEQAIPFLWKSIVTYSTQEAESHVQNYGGSRYPYTVENAFLVFMQCFARQGKLADGYLYVAKQYMRRKQPAEAEMYLNQALQIDPKHNEANLWKDYLGGKEELSEQLAQLLLKQENNNIDHSTIVNAQGHTPEQLHDLGTAAFNNKNYVKAAKYFEQSCQESKQEIGSACANAVFCRTEILDWGINGTQFDKDMERVETLTLMEAMTLSSKTSNHRVRWRRATSVHPHMMLGYPIEARLQRIVDEAYADTDEMRARVYIDPVTGKAALKPLPSDFPKDPQVKRLEYQKQTNQNPNFKIRVGFVSSAIKASAVMYLGHSIFEFIDRTKFEIHIFATSPPDHPSFIQAATGGADWRERVRANVDVFHEIPHLQEDHIALARLVISNDIHIMIDWDGYARQGLRPQGLFALRPAPIQMFHQEFLGTSGAHYVDYLFTDTVTSPPHLADQLYTEKLIYLPNHFFSKGHAVMPEIHAPKFKYKKKTTPYQPGTGSPQTNRCLSKSATHDASFVYCNFHKFLKYNPETTRSWLAILERVPDSMLCLLENPASGVVNFRAFVDQVNPKLNSRIYFLRWENSLIDHQRRNRDLCNVVLDTWPYNGHTTTMDALYAGVPVVTRSDGNHMASRVTTSANIVLEMPELNANNVSHYQDIAVQLATDSDKFDKLRHKLISSCLQTNPMHVFWDVKLYSENFQKGLELAWKHYLNGEPPAHIYVTNASQQKQQVTLINEEL